MKNKLLLVSCALFLFSGTAFAENLLVTKTSGGADEEEIGRASCRERV